MEINLGYKANYILETLGGEEVKEVRDATYCNIDRHLPNFREMKKVDLIKWLERNEIGHDMRLKLIFHKDARLYRYCSIEVSDVWIIEKGNFTNTIVPK
jgi:hypothetical protein